MAKTQAQRTRDYLARTRRKAKAFDKLIAELQFISKYFFDTDRYPEKHMIDSALDAAKAVSEVQE
ncbi:hypothetical protein EVC08_049 [Rhizobium phage RHph_N65]|nr:hypothetical protein EVC08_049 [Rhizobium phage RHph_N65]